MSRKTKIWIAVALIAAIVVGFGIGRVVGGNAKAAQPVAVEATPAPAAEETAVPAPAAEPEKGNDAVILYTNDTHSFINNYVKDADGNEKRGLSFASVRALGDELTANGETVFLADAGDFSQGSAFSAMCEGRVMVELMDAVDYDAVVPGNHEFDYGMMRAIQNFAKLGGRAISCDFYEVDSGLLILPAYKVVERNGVKIGFVGICTPETLMSSTPAYFRDAEDNLLYSFYGHENVEDFARSVQSAIDSCVSEGADYVIGLGHLGDQVGSAPFRSADLIPQVSGLDALIDGHSHSVVPMTTVKDLDGKDVVVSQTGQYFGAIGIMTLKDGEATTELISGYDGRDPAIDGMEQAWIDTVNDELGEKIAESDFDFLIMNANNSEERVSRRMEVNVGDLVTDAIYHHFNLVEQLDCDLAFINSGALRSDVPAGDITYSTCKTLMPFGNVLCLSELSGQTLLDALEWASRSLGEKNDNGGMAEASALLQCAGMRYTIDTTRPCTSVGTDDGEWVSGPADGVYRVSNVEIYNRETGRYEPLDLNRTYRAGSLNYLLVSGGDKLNMFVTDAKLVKDYVGEDYMILAEYCKSFGTKDGGEYPCISSATSPLAQYKGMLINYEDPLGAGRITFIGEH